MSRFVLRIDIEGVNADGDCFRPMDQECLAFESDEPEDVADRFAVLQNEIKEINHWERRQNKRHIEYTVFMWVEDEKFEAGEDETEMLEREEWSLGCYINIKRAKKLMDQAIKIANKESGAK